MKPGDITVLESKEIATIGPDAASPMGMMLAAQKAGASLEQIEKMMDLQQRYDAMQAKKAYDQAFSDFKAEAVQIIKRKKVTDGPLKNKSYAELHDVVNAVTPALSKFGLSSSWKLTIDDKDWMQVTCYLRHVGGHEESVAMGGPPDTGGAKNAIQARASTKTYLERYTLKAITGLAEQNDDDDGNGGPKEEKPKPKRTTSGVAFERMCDAVRAGTYTLDRAKHEYTLTDDQMTALIDIEKEAK